MNAITPSLRLVIEILGRLPWKFGVDNVNPYLVLNKVSVDSNFL
jgi:hypothetical protein